MAKLTRDQILAASDLPTREVPVPEWGGEVIVRSMTLIERERYETDNVKDKGEHALARLIALCCVDETGETLFRPEDVPALERKSGTALLRVLIAAQELNGLGVNGLASAEKNSASGPAAASYSDSPSPSAGPSANSKAA